MKITTFVQLVGIFFKYIWFICVFLYYFLFLIKLLQVAEVDSVEKDSKMECTNWNIYDNLLNVSIFLHYFLDYKDESSRYDGNSSRNIDALAEMSDRNSSPVPSLALTDGDYGAQTTNRHSTLQRWVLSEFSRILFFS